MGLLIGVDEAGYGPNLGPLVITVTAWDVPGEPAKCDLWKCFAEVVAREKSDGDPGRMRRRRTIPDGDGRLHLADSKQVYSPAKGLGRLEKTVLAAFRLLGFSPPAFHHLCEHLIDGGDDSCRSELCVLNTHLPLPFDSQRVAGAGPQGSPGGADRLGFASLQPRPPDGDAEIADRWRDCCERHRVRLHAIRSEIVWPLRWNGLNRENSNKAETLTRLTLRLLRRVWSPADDGPTPDGCAGPHASSEPAPDGCAGPHASSEPAPDGCAGPHASSEPAPDGCAGPHASSGPTPDGCAGPHASSEPALVVADKHGGRNRYDGYLQEIAEGAMIFRLREAHDVSRYRIGKTELRFQAGGEAHLPVALASMVSKYVRELSMELFNRFWAAHVPDLKPTKGYPIDAQRFRAEIAEAQRRLEIPDEALWRER